MPIALACAQQGNIPAKKKNLKSIKGEKMGNFPSIERARDVECSVNESLPAAEHEPSRKARVGPCAPLFVSTWQGTQFPNEAGRDRKRRRNRTGAVEKWASSASLPHTHHSKLSRLLESEEEVAKMNTHPRTRYADI